MVAALSIEGLGGKVLILTLLATGLTGQLAEWIRRSALAQMMIRSRVRFSFKEFIATQVYSLESLRFLVNNVKCCFILYRCYLITLDWQLHKSVPGSQLANMHMFNLFLILHCRSCSITLVDISNNGNDIEIYSQYGIIKL